MKLVMDGKVEDHSITRAERTRMASMVTLPHIFGEFRHWPRGRKSKQRFEPCEVCGNPTRSAICHKCATKGQA